MPRADILSLSEDDLGALATRGKVKEARKELDDGRVSGDLTEDAGALRVTWSDGLTTEVPADTPLRAGRCSCGGVGVCKHLVRLALLVQRAANAAGPVAATEPWDPGAIADDELAKHLRATTLTKARQLDEAGTLAEVVRGTRPVARFHVPGCTVRFLVPGDIRYSACDCARPAPCEHVPLAVWAFRRLDAAKRAGVVTGGAPAPAVDADVLDGAERVLGEMAEQGTSGAGAGWVDRLGRLRARFEAADLVWPAELLGEMMAQQESYANHDARFDPRRVAELLGELVVRLDAIRANDGGLPQRLIRGSNLDRPVEIERGLFWGLGCGIALARGTAEVTAYLYDTKSAQVSVLTKEVVEGEETGPSFVRLGQRVAAKGSSFAALGAGVLQLETARRSARHELMPGRSGVGVLVQERLAWEEIAPPVLVEEFAELEDRLGGLPPSSLRPRRLGEAVHVFQIAKLESARFDVPTNTVQAILRDKAGGTMLLEHPYTSRGRAGAEALLGRLTGGKGDLRFVSGKVRPSAGGLRVEPFGLVWQVGDKRDLQQPWIDGRADEPSGDSGASEGSRTEDAIQGYARRVQELIGELIVLGLRRADGPTVRLWSDLAERGAAVGFARLSGRVAELARHLEARSHTLRWDHAPAVRATLELAGLLRLAGDVV
jgi:hypothetical protein